MAHPNSRYPSVPLITSPLPQESGVGIGSRGVQRSDPGRKQPVVSANVPAHLQGSRRPNPPGPLQTEEPAPPQRASSSSAPPEPKGILDEIGSYLGHLTDIPDAPAATQSSAPGVLDDVGEWIRQLFKQGSVDRSLTRAITQKANEKLAGLSEDSLRKVLSNRINTTANPSGLFDRLSSMLATPASGVAGPSRDALRGAAAHLDPNGDPYGWAQWLGLKSGLSK